MRTYPSDKLLSGLQWGAYEAWSAYGAEVPLAVPSETADQVCHKSQLLKSRTLTGIAEWATGCMLAACLLLLLLLQVIQCYVPYLSGLQLFEHTPLRSVTGNQELV